MTVTTYEKRRMGKVDDTDVRNTEQLSRALTLLRDEVLACLSRPDFTGVVGVKIQIKKSRILAIDTHHLRNV